MNQGNDRRAAVILSLIGIIPVVWLGLLIAPSVKGGLPEILTSLMNAMNDPFHIELCEDSVKAVLVLLLCYGMGVGIYFSTRRNYRRREEHGSAKWGSASAVNKKYAQQPKSENKLLTQNVAIGLNAKKHRRNLNTLVIGGSGAGKTRFFCKPNLMQCCRNSYFVLDPKGEIVRDVGELLSQKEYEVRVLDLISMEKSHCYNPFVYLQSDNDIQRLVTNLFKATTPKGSQSNDPFWDTSASMLLSALVYYLHYEAPEDEQNFAMVMEMLRAGAIENEEDSRPTPLDYLFADLEMDRPDHIALKYYRSYHAGSAKTLKSIQITLAARLEKFNLESLAALTCTDELDLASMGEKKVALFAIIPDNDSSFNFLVSILYTQLFQQLTVMPFGTRKIDTFRTLTTESLAVFIPFRVQDIYHENGIYYGQNVISKNMIIADRRQLLNGNEFILGVSGGGKSFAAKGEIINQMLSGNADIIIIDPEREYSQLVKAMGGEIINISATSPTHINAMDMNREYGDGANPVILKSEFIMSLCEQLIGGNNLGAVQKSIIDRCTASVYRTYQQNDYKGEVPTLQDFRAELLKQSEPEAQEIALAIELFTNGSLNTFAKHTNVDTDNRLICYDILDLGKQLMPIGMLVVLDSILNRITQNRAKGKNTFIFIDEIYLLFQHEYSANFLFTLWNRVRKYGAYASGITQNVDDLLQSHTARTMLANSEFIIMLNQASTDRIELAKLLNISDTQLSYITNVDAGHGLIKVGSSLVPFANKFPKNTKLYKLMTTKLSDIAN